MVLKITQGLESELENFPQEDTNFTILWKVTFMVPSFNQFNLWTDLSQVSSQFTIYSDDPNSSGVLIIVASVTFLESY